MEHPTEQSTFKAKIKELSLVSIRVTLFTTGVAFLPIVTYNEIRKTGNI